MGCHLGDTDSDQGEALGQVWALTLQIPLRVHALGDSFTFSGSWVTHLLGA